MADETIVLDLTGLGLKPDEKAQLESYLSAQLVLFLQNIGKPAAKRLGGIGPGRIGIEVP